MTATGTDVGKTYVTALLVKKLRAAGYKAGYYKAAISGANTLEDSDAGYVNRIAGIGQAQETLLSYLYQKAVSPHLAAKIEKNPLVLSRVRADYQRVQQEYDFVTVEGSGGIVCPLRYDETEQIMLADVIKALKLNTLIIADAGLGAINAVVLTVAYMRGLQIGIKGVIVNRYTGGLMQEDNVKMIEALAQVPVLALVAPGEQDLDLPAERIAQCYE